MKKLITLFICLSVFKVHAKKQGQAAIDSMKVALQTAKEDTEKVKLLGNISFIYCTINPEEGIKYGTKALELAQKINWEKGIGLARYYRASNYLNTSKLPEALEDYLASLNYFEKAHDQNKLAGTYSNIGTVYGYQSKNEKALEYFLKALEINHNYNSGSNFEVANLGNIGIIYFNKKDYAKALDYNQKALEICIKNKHIDMLANAYVTISGIQIELGDYMKALENSKKAMAIAREIDNMVMIANSYRNTGVVIMKMTMQNNKQFIDSLYNGNKQAVLKDARINLDSAVTLLQQLGDLNLVSTTYEALSELEEYAGNYPEALKYQRLFKSFNDSAFNSDKNERILQISMQYEFDKKESATKAEQEKKDIRQRNIRNSITAALVGALIFGVVIYRQRNKISKARKRSDELLLNILPSEVAEELKAKGSADAKQFDDVTVMFTDFKNFTQISEKLSPTELVSEIHTCFKAFDIIIGKHNIEKIKTIGDAYMCAGGLPVTNTTNATDVVNAALEIQVFMKNHKEEREKNNLPVFEIRIGIHTGAVVAGIVGVKKFAYDIWGDTVNIASRMESSSEAGKVNISGGTYELVKGKFNCTHRGKIQAKNKGEIDMYFVEHKS